VSRSEFSKQTARAKQGVLMQRRFLLLARIAIPAAMLVVVPIAVLAGGKAEPLRIEFKHGAYGARSAKACVATKKQNTYSAQTKVND
jgi:hypothetical protein